MISLDAIRQAIEHDAIANLGGITLRFGNDDRDAANETTWVRVSVLFTSIARNTFTGAPFRGQRVAGIAEFQIFTREGIGTTNITSTMDTIRQRYNEHLITAGNTRIEFMAATIENSGYNEGHGWFMANMRAPFVVFE